MPIQIGSGLEPASSRASLPALIKCTFGVFRLLFFSGINVCLPDCSSFEALGCEITLPEVSYRNALRLGVSLWSLFYLPDLLRHSFSLHYRMAFGSLPFRMQQPLCLGCNGSNVRAMLARRGAYVKKTFLPVACWRCSSVPWLYRARPVTICIDARLFQHLATYENLKLAKTRDIHSALTNIVDNEPGYSISHALILDHIELLSLWEHLRVTFYSPHTTSYMYSTPWVFDAAYTDEAPKTDSDAAGDELVMPPGIINRLRTLWHFATDHLGLLPQQVLVGGDVAQAVALAPQIARVPLGSDAATLGLEPATEVNVPPDGYEVMVTTTETAVRTGPLVAKGCVWARKNWQNRVCSAQLRTLPKQIYMEQSAPALRLALLFNHFQRVVMTNKRIDEAFERVVGNKQLVDIVSDKFTKEQIEEAVTKMEIQTEEPRKRAGNTKFEVIAKDKKASRSVVDAGLQLLAINTTTCRVMEDIMFDPEHGVFSRLSIKHRDRTLVLDDLVAQHSVPIAGGAVGVEVDQTGMELHERINKHGVGVLAHVYFLLGMISKRVSKKLEGRLDKKYQGVIEKDVRKGMMIKLMIGDGADAKRVTLKFSDMYLDSGWLLTSACNFIVELFVTLVAHVDDPERLFTFNTKLNKFYIQLVEGGQRVTKGRTLTTRPSHKFTFHRDKKECYFYVTVEGDDVFGRCSEWLSLDAVANETNERYKQMGFETKLKYIANGRAEFIGAHFTIKGGLAVGEWVPAVARYMSKVGWMCSNEPSPANIVARFCSIAMMFGGKLEAFAMLFYNLALGWSRVEGCDLSTTVYILPYSEEAKVFSGDHLSLKEMLGTASQRVMSVYPSVATQVRLVSNSLEAPFTVADLNKVQLLADVITPDMDDEVAFLQLPLCLQRLAA